MSLRSGGLRRDVLSLLSVLQVAAIVATLLFGVLGYPVLATDDEYVHLDYVAKLATGQGLPLVGVDENEPEVLALLQGTYPGPPATPAAAAGLSGQSYEGVHPPLYYASVAPLFHLAEDWRVKVRLLRAGSAAFVLLGVWFFWCLCREVVPDEPQLAFVLGGAALALPLAPLTLVGVTNASLEMTLATAFSLLAWRAWHRVGARALVGAGVLLGLLLLTKVTAAPFALVLATLLVRDLLRSSQRRTVPVVLAALAPVLIVLPWLLHNMSRYGAPTGNSAHTRLVLPTVNPSGTDVSLVASLGEMPSVFLRSSLPQALGPEFADGNTLTLAAVAGVLLWILPAALLVLQARLLDHCLLVVCVLPTIVLVGYLALASATSDVPLTAARYFLPVLPVWSVAAVRSYELAGPGRRLPLLLALVLSATCVATWASIGLPG